jgi:hypothetical protein
VGKSGRCLRLTNLPPSCAVVKKSANLNFLETSGLLQDCNGTALPLPGSDLCLQLGRIRTRTDLLSIQIYKRGIRPTSCDIIIINARESSNLHIVDSECNPTIIRVLKFQLFAQLLSHCTVRKETRTNTKCKYPIQHHTE